MVLRQLFKVTTIFKYALFGFLDLKYIRYLHINYRKKANNRSLKRLVEIRMEAQISLPISYKPYIKTNSFKVIVRIMHLKK